MQNKITIFSILLFIGFATPLFADTHQQMHTAICNHNLSKVKSLVARGYHINRPMGQDDDGENREYPLELASYCFGGAANIANYLIARGANVNQHISGYTPLMWALRSIDDRGDAFHKVVIKMIKRGANVNHQDEITGRTPLMGAASHGLDDVVQMLMTRGADKSKSTHDDWCISGNQDLQCTAAMYARLEGHVLTALIIEGKSSAAYKRGLNYAIIKGNSNQANRLIASGDGINAKEKLSDLTALHYAVQYKRRNIVKQLLDAGANPDVKQLHGGTTPLRNAIVNYERVMAKFLINGGAKGNHKQTQGCGGGNTEFDWAVEYGLADIAKLMIDKGSVNVRKPGHYGYEGLIHSLYGRNQADVELVKHMVVKGYRSNGVDVDYVDVVYANNSWMQENPQSRYYASIKSILKTSTNKPAPVVTELEEEQVGPDVPEEETGEIEIINPWLIKSRSMKVDQVMGRRFNQLYQKGKRAGNPLESSTDRLPLK